MEFMGVKHAHNQYARNVKIFVIKKNNFTIYQYPLKILKIYMNALKVIYKVKL